MKKNHIVLPLLGLLAYILITGYSSGPGTTGLYNGTGSEGLPPGCGSSSGCHATTAAPEIAVSFQLLSGTTPVTSYTAGASYTIRLTGTYTSATSAVYPNFGFQISVMEDGSILDNAGTFGTLPAGTQLSSTVGAAVVVEHNSSLVATTGTGGSGTTYVVNIPWTAPAAGTGSVKLWGVMNMVNPPVSPATTDRWQTGTLLITEGSSTSVGPISGTLLMCAGTTTTLTCTPAGGTWSSSTPAVGTVSAAGVVAGITSGTTTITYTATAGTATAVVTVNAAPAAITGTATACIGTTTTLSCTTPSGTWSSGTIAVATVGATTGVVTGVASGTAVISYTNSTACSSTKIVTINAAGAAPITGTANVCVATTITLSNLTPGGTWTSSAPARATVGATTGIVTGVTVGTTVISYTATNTCGSSTTTKTINVLTAGSCTSAVLPIPDAKPLGIAIYPNPNNGTFTLSMESDINEEAHVVVTGITGKKIKEFTTVTNTKADMSMPQIAGLYFVSVSTAHGNYVTRFMVQ